MIPNRPAGGFDMSAQIKAESEKWAKVIQAGNIKPQ
jgi:hypothetical protein